MNFTYRDNFGGQYPRSLPFVLSSLPEVEPPKSLLKPKKPWEHLNKTAYKSKKS